jgi:hypothetical protein
VIFDNNELAIPNIFQTYYYDFGGTDEDVLTFIWHWLDDPEYSLDEILGIAKKSLKIRYYPLG